jgi:hypothetical protein
LVAYRRGPATRDSAKGPIRKRKSPRRGCGGAQELRRLPTFKTNVARPVEDGSSQGQPRYLWRIFHRLESEQLDASQLGELGCKPVLEPGIGRRYSGVLPLVVMPIAATDPGGGIVADRKPSLCEVTHFEIAGCSATAHFRRHPARIDGVAEKIGPLAGDREGERRDIEFAFGVRAAVVPAALDPIDVLEHIAAAPMQAAAKVNQSLRSLDERGRSTTARRAVYASVMDYHVHPANGVNLVRDAAGFDGTTEIADDPAG